MAEPGCCQQWLRRFAYCFCVFPSIAIAVLSIAIGLVYRYQDEALTIGHGLEIPASLEGQTVLITGSAKGIGYFTAGEYCRLGAHVILHGTNMKRTSDAAVKLKMYGCPLAGKVTPMAFDLGNFTAVREGAREISERFGLLDVLVLNASPGGGGQGIAPSGFHIVYACELGHFLLFNLLENRIAQGARIVFQTSLPHWVAQQDWMFPSEPLPPHAHLYLPGPYTKQEGQFWYSLAKMADVCFKEGLNRKWAGKIAGSSVLNVGDVDTEIWMGLQHWLRHNKVRYWLGPADKSGRTTFESAYAPRGFEPGVVLSAYWYPKAIFGKYVDNSNLKWRQENWDYFFRPQLWQRLLRWGTLHTSPGPECSVETQEKLWQWMASKTGL